MVFHAHKQFDSAVLHAVRSAGHKADTWKILSQRWDYWVIQAQTDRGVSLIVKLAGRGAREPIFEVAAASHRLAEGLTKLPLAQILSTDDSYSQVPYRFSVQTKVEGETWFSRRPRLGDNDLQVALCNIGEVVAELHRPRLPTFGSLTPGIEQARQSAVDALREHGGRIIQSMRLREAFLELLTDRRRAFDPVVEAGITHEDLHGFNILFDPSHSTRIAAVIDFDKAWAGPVESDIARMELWGGMTSPSFMAAYRARHPELPGYEERRPIYQLLWCFEYAVASPEHLQTTNDLASRLGLPPVASFAS